MVTVVIEGNIAVSYTSKMFMKLTPDEYPSPNVTKHFGTIISQCVVL
jgi:hypothetical protein